jgi:peptidoglycan/xylan/chitin deacetylase (PgdA/CDA1 family)
MAYNANAWIPESNIWVEDFEAQLDLIKRSEVKVISMPEALSLIEKNNDLKGRYLCITFDDGYKNNLTVAWPLLKKYGMPAHFFITVEALDQKLYNWDLWKKGTQVVDMPNEVLLDLQPLTSQDIKFLLKEGATIGSHGMTHERISGFSDKKLLEDLRRSKEILEKLVGGNVETFAYPFGSFDEKSRHILRVAKYKCAFTVKAGRNNLGRGIDPLRLRRYSTLNNISPAIFERILNGGYDFIRIKDHLLLKSII